MDLVCCLLRTNLGQHQVAAIYQVSQVTASRRWDLLRKPIARALAAVVPTVRQVVGTYGSVLVDGFPVTSYVAPQWGSRPPGPA